MTKLLFLSLGTSFILSACSSLPSGTAFAQPQSVSSANAATPEQPSEYANSVLSASIEAQQQRIEALEYQLAKLQTQVNALSKSLSAPSAPTIEPSATKPTVDAPLNTDQSRHDQALSLYQRKEYVAMVGLLKDYANGGNGSQAAQSNMFLLSAAHFNLSNCEASISIGRRFANDFKQHPDAPRALYNIANCQLSMKQNDVAKVTLRNLIRTYPNSTEAQRAKILLK